MNLLSFLSPGLTAATEAASGAQAGQLQNADRQQKQALQFLALKRQQEQDEQDKMLKIAQARHFNAEAANLEHPLPTKNIMRGPGGQLVDMTDPTNPKPVGPAPAVKPVAPVMGSPEWIAAQRAKAKIAAEFRPPQRDSYAFPVVTGPDGKPVVARANTKTGAIEPTDIGKPSSASGGGQSLAPEDRLKMLNQAKLDHQTMMDFENKVLAGQAKVGTVAGLAGEAADAHGGTLNKMIGVLGNAAVGHVDPRYQQYLTAMRSYGRIMGNLQSKRYTDHQAEIEKSISGLQGNDLANTIRYKQQLRESSLADPTVTPSTGGGRGGAPTVSPSKGDIDLRGPSTQPTKAAGRDYGVFGKPPGEDDDDE